MLVEPGINAPVWLRRGNRRTREKTNFPCTFHALN